MTPVLRVSAVTKSFRHGFPGRRFTVAVLLVHAARRNVVGE